MKIHWTPTERRTYFKVLDYLQEEWTKHEMKSFIDEIETVLKLIVENPQLFEASRKSKHVRKGFITKHNTLYYRVKPRKKELELITFWETRQDPKKLAYWED